MNPEKETGPPVSEPLTRTIESQNYATAAVAASVIEIRELHDQIHSAARTTLEKAIRIGCLLAGIKGGIAHGEWLAWVEVHLPFSVRSAQNYVRLFDNREQLKYASNAYLTEAYKLLAEPKEATSRPNFIPGPGLALVGEGGGWIVAIVPSAEHQGFYYVTVLSPAGTDDDGGWMDFNKRPIRSDGIDLLSLRCVPTAELRWSERAAEPWSYNKLAYSTAAEALADRWAS